MFCFYKKLCYSTLSIIVFGFSVTTPMSPGHRIPLCLFKILQAKHSQPVVYWGERRLSLARLQRHVGHPDHLPLDHSDWLKDGCVTSVGPIKSLSGNFVGNTIQEIFSTRNHDVKNYKFAASWGQLWYNMDTDYLKLKTIQRNKELKNGQSCDTHFVLDQTGIKARKPLLGDGINKGHYIHTPKWATVKTSHSWLCWLTLEEFYDILLIFILYYYFFNIF